MGKIGDRSVVIGDVGDRDIGVECVVIGATHPNGNTLLNGSTPMAVGSGAKAGPGSIAIGYQANAGLGRDELEFRQALADLEALIQHRCDEQIKEGFKLLKGELALPAPNKGKLRFLLGGISVVSSLDGASNVFDKVANGIQRILESC